MDVCLGVVRSDKLLKPSHFLSFPIIPVVAFSQRNPHPSLSQRERGFSGGGGSLASFGPVWPRLLLRSRLEMRPPWPCLALGSLVRADQRGLVSIVVASLRVARSGKPLILFRFVPFRSIPYRLRGAGMRGFRLRGNDGEIRGNDACDQCTGWRGDGAMGSCRWFWGWAYVWSGVTLRRAGAGMRSLSQKSHRRL